VPSTTPWEIYGFAHKALYSSVQLGRAGGGGRVVRKNHTPVTPGEKDMLCNVENALSHVI